MELWRHLRSTTSTGASSWSANLGNVTLPNCSVAAASSVICTHWLRWIFILSVSFVPGCGRSMDAVLGDVDALRDE